MDAWNPNPSIDGRSGYAQMPSQSSLGDSTLFEVCSKFVACHSTMIGYTYCDSKPAVMPHLAQIRANCFAMNKKELLRGYKERWVRIEEAMDRAEIKSQRALGRRLGIEGPSVNGWAKGRHLPDMIHILALAEWSGTCVEYLWTGRGPKHPLFPEICSMIEAFELLSPERRVEILRFAKFRDGD